MTNTTALTISTSTSRGADTYGYTIVRLDDPTTGKRYRCMGGGYDMVGTVFAEWLQETHQDALQAVKGRAYYSPGDLMHPNADGLYGMRLRSDGTVTLDGACGLESIRRIAKEIGVDVTTTYSKRAGRTVALVVTTV